MNLNDMAHFMLKEGTCTMLTALMDIEVKCTKSQLKDGLLLSLDGTTAVTEDIRKQLITTSHCMTPKQIENAVDAVRPRRSSGWLRSTSGTRRK